MTDISRKTRVADSRKVFNDAPDVPSKLVHQEKSALNIYMITNRRDPWNKSEITNLFQATSLAEAADAFVKSIAGHEAGPVFPGGVKIAYHKGLRFQVCEYMMPQDAGRMNLNTYHWYSVKDHPQWAEEFHGQNKQTEQAEQTEQGHEIPEPVL